MTSVIFCDTVCQFTMLFPYGVVSQVSHVWWQNHWGISNFNVTLPKTNSSPLKMVVSKFGMSFSNGLFSRAKMLLVSWRVNARWFKLWPCYPLVGCPYPLVGCPYPLVGWPTQPLISGYVFSLTIPKTALVTRRIAGGGKIAIPSMHVICPYMETIKINQM